MSHRPHCRGFAFFAVGNVLRCKLWRILIFLLEYISFICYNDTTMAERSSEVQSFRIGYIGYGHAV